MNKILLLFFFFFCVSIKIYAQFKEFYEQIYFNSPNVFNPAKIAPKAGFNPYNEFNYDKQELENKLNVQLIVSSAYQQDFNNLNNNNIFSVNYNIAKKAALGIYIDQYSIGLFKRFSYSLKYGYQIIFNNNIKLAAGFSIGNINNSISATNSNNLNTINNLLNDTRVREFNSNNNELYTDFGLNLMIQNLNLQLVKYHVDKNVKKDIIQDEPDFLGSMDYTIETDIINHKIALGVINFFNKNVDRMFINYSISYNPITIYITANTLNQYSSSIDFAINKNILFFIGYNFGGYYANPVNNGAGNMLAGIQLKLF